MPGFAHTSPSVAPATDSPTAASVDPAEDPMQMVETATLQADLGAPRTALRAAIATASRRDEQSAVHALLREAPSSAGAQSQARSLAARLVQAVRSDRLRAFGVDALMHAYPLSSPEGRALMSVAEALLRIPDAASADALIADKLSMGNWQRAFAASPSPSVNAAALGLLLASRLASACGGQGKAMTPVRLAMRQAMRRLGRQFVAGRTIEEALANSRNRERRGYRHSYDMLGEAALTEDDATRYFAAYEHAIRAIGQFRSGDGVLAGPGISVKLSALHPRYLRAQRARVMVELLPRLKALLLLARRQGIGVSIDAEEASRLELSLDLLEALARDPDLAGFDGIGFVVQAYQKRCPDVINYLLDLARQTGHRFMLRLVKGAYWDTEIKCAQIDGLPAYPVFTRKAHTDVCYLACARQLLAAGDAVHPQFATHNAHTVATIHTWAREASIREWEFQCLHGMGEALYDEMLRLDSAATCRIYAPVGTHETLLAYLVRRLLENGANTSFVNRVVDESLALESLLADPFDLARQGEATPHPGIALPEAMYGADQGNGRRNARGLDLNDEDELRELEMAFSALAGRRWHAHALLAAPTRAGAAMHITNPANRRDLVGQVVHADETDVDTALAAACVEVPLWAAQPVAQRAALLEHAADLLERERNELMVLAVREAGKSLPNALAEVREAVDFLRYYAAQARLEGPAQALGPVVCISPWNFPLAIFVGQIAGALAAGNVVLAKPAEQTPLIAQRAVELLHEAGIPRAALQCLPGSGDAVGAALVGDARVRGVLFTGSNEVAQHIHATLLARRLKEREMSEMGEERGEIPLIAETGGQNAMIVDSSALTEQVVQDVLVSAFDSAGQRCSALRVLCLQEHIAERTIAMLKGAMRELRVGNPLQLCTDVGPVIDEDARRRLREHIDAMRARGCPVFCLDLPSECTHGSFVAPTLIEIGAIDQLTHEVFGPVLHVLRYRHTQLPQLVDAINASGYGLTLGIHSRIDTSIAFITHRARVGNIYVNRNMIGAVVGVQPFGGEGLSGTGPKAGGPLYLKRLQRNAANPMPADAMPASRPALAALQAFAGARGMSALARLIEGYQRFALLGTTLHLPGPTGESNTLDFKARGTILCAASNSACLLNQIAACLATGNRIMLLPENRDLLPAGLPDIVHSCILISPDLGLANQALVDDGQVPALLPRLAAPDKRARPLVMAIGCADERPVPLWRLVVERSVCINTAAAGGNPGLLALGEGFAI